MKKKISFTILLAFVLAVCIALYLRLNQYTSPNVFTADHLQIMEKTSDTHESSYTVAANLPASDFSSVGTTLSDKITQEWNTYDNMTEEQRLLSSKLWGCVGIQTDTWNDCEEAIGFAVYNPLESLDWLNKTGYFGMESADTNTPVKHVQINADTTAADRKLSEINITAGYKSGNVRITLTAVLSSDDKTYTSVAACDGYASYEEDTTATGGGVPVLIVTTSETNNNGYYNGDYFDPTAYWVKDNVFYALRVFGDETDKAEIQSTLNRILDKI